MHGLTFIMWLCMSDVQVRADLSLLGVIHVTDLQCFPDILWQHCELQQGESTLLGCQECIKVTTHAQPLLWLQMFRLQLLLCSHIG